MFQAVVVEYDGKKEERKREGAAIIYPTERRVAHRGRVQECENTVTEKDEKTVTKDREKTVISYLIEIRGASRVWAHLLWNDYVTDM